MLIPLAIDLDPAPHSNGHSSPPLFGPCLLWPNGRPRQQLLRSCFYILFTVVPIFVAIQLYVV